MTPPGRHDELRAGSTASERIGYAAIALVPERGRARGLPERRSDAQAARRPQRRAAAIFRRRA